MKNVLLKMIGKVKRKYTKRTFNVADKDIITEFHPEYLYNIFKID